MRVRKLKFHWTKWNLIHKRKATVVTTRHSGGSYLNRVEMQNGCLALAHSNLFIPSTLTGSNITGEGLDTDKLSTNLNMAIDVYIDRVSGAPCGGNTIDLLKGAKDDDAKNVQDQREDLLTFLKGSVTKKAELKEAKPDIYSYFEMVCDLRNHHMVKGCHKSMCSFCCHVMNVIVFIPCVKADSLNKK
jgi:hypothetical protein